MLDLVSIASTIINKDLAKEIEVNNITTEKRKTIEIAIDPQAFYSRCCRLEDNYNPC